MKSTTTYVLRLIDVGNMKTCTPRMRRALKALLRSYNFRALAMYAEETTPAPAATSGNAPPRPAQAPGGLPTPPAAPCPVNRPGEGQQESDVLDPFP